MAKTDIAVSIKVIESNLDEAAKKLDDILKYDGKEVNIDANVDTDDLRDFDKTAKKTTKTIKDLNDKGTVEIGKGANADGIVTAGKEAEAAAKKTVKNIDDILGDEITDSQYKAVKPWFDAYKSLNTVMNDANIDMDNEAVKQAVELMGTYGDKVQEFMKNPTLGADELFDNPEEMLVRTKDITSALNANLKEQQPIIEQQNQLRKAIQQSVNLGGQSVKETDAYKQSVQQLEQLEKARKMVASGRDVQIGDDGLEVTTQRAISATEALKKVNLPDAIGTEKLVSDLKTAGKEYSRFALDNFKAEGQAMKKAYDQSQKAHGLEEANLLEDRIDAHERLVKQIENGTSVQEAFNKVNEEQIKLGKQQVSMDDYFAGNDQAISSLKKRTSELAEVGEMSRKKLDSTVKSLENVTSKNQNALFTEHGQLVQEDLSYLRELQKLPTGTDLNKRLIADGKSADYLDGVLRRQIDFERTAALPENKGTTTNKDLTDAILKGKDFLSRNNMAYGSDEYKQLTNLLDTMSSISSKKDQAEFQKSLREADLSGTRYKTALEDAMTGVKSYLTDKGVKGSLSDNEFQRMSTNLGKLVSQYSTAEFTTPEQQTAYDQIVRANEMFSKVSKEASQNGRNLGQAFESMNVSMADGVKMGQNAMTDMNNLVGDKLIKGTERYNTVMGQVQKGIRQTNDALSNFGTPGEGSAGASYTTLQNDVLPGYEKLQKGIQAGTYSETAAKKQLAELSSKRAEHAEIIKMDTVGMDTIVQTIEKNDKQLKRVDYSRLRNDTDRGNYYDLMEINNRQKDMVDYAKQNDISVQEAYSRNGMSMGMDMRDAQRIRRNYQDSLNNQLLDTKSYNDALRQTNSLTANIEDNLNGWTKARKSSKSAGDYQELQRLRDESRALSQGIQDGTISRQQYQEQLSGLRRQYDDTSHNIKANGDNTASFGDKLQGALSKFSEWYIASQLAMAGFSKVKEAFSNVVDMDTAMTELKKVTNETSSTYDKFYVNAGKRAQEYGATVTDTITATADFARLGFGIEDAAKAADAAIVYKNVGDGISDIGTASESIISTMKAFDMEAGESMTIVDKFNEVGKRKLPKGTVMYWSLATC